MFDNGSKVDSTFKAIVKNHNLEIEPHAKPYTFDWVCDDSKLQVRIKCKLKFSITANFIDEVEFDGAPLDICGIILGSPYLYDQKSIFYHNENKYHIFKY